MGDAKLVTSVLDVVCMWVLVMFVDLDVVRFVDVVEFSEYAFPLPFLSLLRSCLKYFSLSQTAQIRDSQYFRESGMERVRVSKFRRTNPLKGYWTEGDLRARAR